MSLPMPDGVAVPDLLLLAGASYLAWLIGTLSGGLLIPVLTWLAGPSGGAPMPRMIHKLSE